MNNMINLINIKKDLIYAIANRFKINTEDIDIKKNKISYRHGYVSVEWRYEKDKENADTRENQFAFKDFIKEKENEKQKNNKN